MSLRNTSACGCRPILVSRASRSALGWAGPGQLCLPLNINALRVNLVNIDIVDNLDATLHVSHECVHRETLCEVLILSKGWILTSWVSWP